MKNPEEFQGHSGLYSLSIKLEHITAGIEGAADKDSIRRLRELAAGLKVLSKEWQQSGPKQDFSSALKPAVNSTFPRNGVKL